jgi:hypothetical protein
MKRKLDPQMIPVRTKPIVTERPAVFETAVPSVVGAVVVGVTRRL